MQQYNNNLVSLNKVVSAAIVDSYEEKGKVESQYFHWAAREFKDLNSGYLKLGKRYVTLYVNQNTRTAALPVDFKKDIFVGIIDRHGEKVSLSVNTKLVDNSNVEEIECEDKCERCGQNKAICEDLQVTEEVNLIVIGSSTYEQNIVKKLYPNGDYYLETTNPIYNTVTQTVDYVTTKQFINNLDLKPCGCLETTAENLSLLQSCASDVYGCYYASCNSCDPNLGGYKIFEDTGLIQFDYNFRYTTVYLEYEGFLPKINGQLQVPEVAFEATVEGTKFRSVKNRKNEPQWRIILYKDAYKEARSKMIRVMGRVSLNHIIEAATRIPKFDIKKEPSWYNCFASTPTTTSSTTTSLTEIIPSSAGTIGGSIIEVTRLGFVFGKRRFTIGESGSPIVEGQSSLILKDDNSVTEKNVMSKSVNVIIDGSVIEEIDYAGTFEAEQLQYKVLYTASQTTIYFNQGSIGTQKYRITYVKTA